MGEYPQTVKAQPPLVRGQNARMKVKAVDVLAANLTALCAAAGNADRPSKWDEEVAAKAGVNMTNVSRWRRGKQAAGIDQLDHLAAALATPQWDLLTPGLGRDRLSEGDLRGFEGHLIAIYRQAATPEAQKAIIAAAELAARGMTPQPDDVLAHIGPDARSLALKFDALDRSTPEAVGRLRRLHVQLMGEIQRQLQAPTSTPPGGAAPESKPARRQDRETRRG